MQRLSEGDFDHLQSGLRILYAHHDLDTLPRAAVQLVCKLVPSDQTTYNEVDPIRKRLAVVSEPVEREHEIIERAAIWEKHMHQHPLLAHFLQHPADEPKKISDFLTDDQFRRLDLYREFFKLLDIQYQMVTTMPAPRPLTVGIALNRGDKDFDERDRDVLRLLQPHLRQAYENASLITELSDELGRAYDVLDRINRGVVVIDERGRVDRASGTAVRFSTEHFAGEANAGLARELPDTLKRWAVAQIAALRQRDDGHRRPAPMILERVDGRLILRVVTDRRPDRFLLIMHRADLPDSAEPLEGLGLTRREAEALHGAVAGKTSAEIAAVMGISERTVDKHLENLYRKLGVASRAAAVNRALEWLRL